jgi:hypothetical protein
VCNEWISLTQHRRAPPRTDPPHSAPHRLLTL